MSLSIVSGYDSSWKSQEAVHEKNVEVDVDGNIDVGVDDDVGVDGDVGVNIDVGVDIDVDVAHR